MSRRPVVWLSVGVIFLLLMAGGGALVVLGPDWFGGSDGVDGSSGQWPDGYLLEEHEIPRAVEMMDASSRGWEGSTLDEAGRNPARVPDEDLDAFLLHGETPVEWWIEGLTKGSGSTQGLIWVNVMRWEDAAAAERADVGSICKRPGSSFGMTEFILGVDDVTILITYSDTGDPVDEARAVHERLLEKTPSLRDLCA